MNLLALPLLLAVSASAETLQEWKFFETPDALIAVRATDWLNAEQSSRGLEGADFARAAAFSFKFAPLGRGRELRAEVKPAGLLKIYRSPQPGLQPIALCAGESECLDGGDQSASRCEPAECRRLTIDRPQEGRAGTRLTASDLERPLAVNGSGSMAASLEKARLVERPAPAAAQAAAKRASAIAEKLNLAPKDEGLRDTVAPAYGVQAAKASPPALPPHETVIRKRAFEIHAAQTKYRKDIPSIDRYIVVNKARKIIAMSDDAETAQKIAIDGAQVYRIPAAAPKAKRKTGPPSPKRYLDENE